MKKNYINPTIEIHKMATTKMLMGSITEVGDDLNVIISSDPEMEDATDAVSREDDFDWKCLKNKIYTTPGFANIFHKPEIMLWACYETLSQILSQSNDGVTDSMCICPYNRRKFYIKAENDYVVLLIPNEY